MFCMFWSKFTCVDPSLSVKSDGMPSTNHWILRIWSKIWTRGPRRGTLNNEPKPLHPTIHVKGTTYRWNEPNLPWKMMVPLRWNPSHAILLLRLSSFVVLRRGPQFHVENLFSLYYSPSSSTSCTVLCFFFWHELNARGEELAAKALKNPDKKHVSRLPP